MGMSKMKGLARSYVSTMRTLKRKCSCVKNVKNTTGHHHYTATPLGMARVAVVQDPHGLCRTFPW